jgi:starch phosphorylase
MKVHSLNVIPHLPDNIKVLEELCHNMWFTWNWPAIKLFVSMDADLWQRSHRNPKWVLGNIDSEKLKSLSENKEFVEAVGKTYEIFKQYKQGSTWYDENKKPENADTRIAYFSMEFGIGEGLPMYSGGLGMLSGDHIKSSSDLGLPLVGMGLFYQKGYIQQVINSDGWQVENFPENDWANMPVEKARDASGKAFTIDVSLGSEIIKVSVWRVDAGRIPIYLLDTNLPDNPSHHRNITEQLYGGDRDTRIKQEIVLGIGGVKALKAMGVEPTVYHINEGHSAFLLLERIRNLMHEKKLSFEQARQIVWVNSVFTTHTPVSAGNEYFDPHLMKKYFEPYAYELGLTWEQFMDLGKETPISKMFCLTVLALKLSHYLNGVSELHSQVSKKMWRKIWPETTLSEIPITAITNGIHTPSWITHEHLELYQKYILKEESVRHCDPVQSCDWSKVDSIPEEELWQIHKIRKEKMIAIVRQRYRNQLKRYGSDITVLNSVDKILDPEALTIGFARRFATYKRAALIFKDPDRLAKIINDPHRPIQLVFAGKAHQADSEGKKILKTIVELANDSRFKNKLLFVEDYNMNIARYMVQGVDVWLNNPVRPMEASGTSGMKAAVNGVLNLSVLDGWWCEGYDSELGWAIGGFEHYDESHQRDDIESEAICNIIQKEIAPLYYDRDSRDVPVQWIKMVKNSIKAITPRFSTNNMVRQYFEKFYVPAHGFYKSMLSADKARSVADWFERIKQNWPYIKIENMSPKIEKGITSNDNISYKVKVWLGSLSHEDVYVQVYCGRLGVDGELSRPQIIDMKYEGKKQDISIFTASQKTLKSGRHDYAIRVIPKRDDLPYPLMPPLIKCEK